MFVLSGFGSETHLERNLILHDEHLVDKLEGLPELGADGRVLGLTLQHQPGVA